MKYLFDKYRRIALLLKGVIDAKSERAMPCWLFEVRPICNVPMVRHLILSTLSPGLVHLLFDAHTIAHGSC